MLSFKISNFTDSDSADSDLTDSDLSDSDLSDIDFTDSNVYGYELGTVSEACEKSAALCE